MARLPREIWVIIFDYIRDNNSLWSILRNVSHELRTSVDIYFRQVLRRCTIYLRYSTIHWLKWPHFRSVDVPMQLTRFSADGTRAVFQQLHILIPISGDMPGSVRGWVPFIERYHKEMEMPPPQVKNKSECAKGGPLWEKEHEHLCNTLGSDKSSYLAKLREYTSIGRGDCPPYFISVPASLEESKDGISYLHDSELVDLAMDCSAKEISFEWRHTLSFLFREQQFIVLAKKNENKAHVHGQELDTAPITEVLSLDIGHPWKEWQQARRQARRKRLTTWVAKNKERMSKDHRLVTESRVMRKEDHLQVYWRLRTPCTRAMPSWEEFGESEIVPEKCADDCEELMMWNYQ